MPPGWVEALHNMPRVFGGVKRNALPTACAIIHLVSKAVEVSADNFFDMWNMNYTSCENSGGVV
jgi:hypothetical protein